MSASDGHSEPAADVSTGDEWTVALLAIARNRDRQAYQRVFLHFAPRVKSYMMRAGMAPSAAEEIAQDAMLTVWRKAELFDAGRASATTWIFAIARNLRIDAARREGRAHSRNDASGANLAGNLAGNLAANLADSLAVPDPAPLSDAVLVRAEAEGLVRSALAALPQDQATIIRLSFFEDQPHARIAHDLHIPLGTVKSRVRLAVARLRKLLEDRP